MPNNSFVSYRCQQVQRENFEFKNNISEDWITQTNALLSEGYWFNKTVVGSFNEHSVWCSAHYTHANQARKNNPSSFPQENPYPKITVFC